MQKILLALAVLPLSFATLPAQAFPMSATPAVAPQITLVAGGCGLGYHRGPFGGCRPNGGPVLAVRRCPPGFHMGPYGRACRPNF